MLFKQNKTKTDKNKEKLFYTKPLVTGYCRLGTHRTSFVYRRSCLIKYLINYTVIWGLVNEFVALKSRVKRSPCNKGGGALIYNYMYK